MKISTRELDGVVVADMEGRLESSTAGYTSDELVRISQGDCKQVLVNLEKLEFITSAGLRSLLVAAKLLQSSKGQFKLCCANDAVKQVLVTCGFDSLISLYDTEAEAIQSF